MVYQRREASIEVVRVDGWCVPGNQQDTVVADVVQFTLSVGESFGQTGPALEQQRRPRGEVEGQQGGVTGVHTPQISIGRTRGVGPVPQHADRHLTGFVGFQRWAQPGLDLAVDRCLRDQTDGRLHGRPRRNVAACRSSTQVILAPVLIVGHGRPDTLERPPARTR